MGGLRRKSVPPPPTDDEIIRALARVPGQLPRFRRFRHAGKSYVADEAGVPPSKPGTLVATGYAVSVVADGHRPNVDEMAAALDAFEGLAHG
jgi:hypothetical protein